MANKNHKLDIFKVLDNISKKNILYYKNLTDEEKKSLQPLVVMRWLSGTSSARQVYFLNELVNPFVFPLAKHKELLSDLMTVCSPGRQQRYYWNKTKSTKGLKMPNAVGVIRDFFGYNSTDANDALPLLTNENIIDIAEQMGRQPDDIKAIKKELKIRST